MSKFCENMGTLDHDAYCSAPPFVTPPRPSRAQEGQRPRAPIEMDGRGGSEAEDDAWRAAMMCEVYGSAALDVKPDIKPDLPIVQSAAVSTSPATSSPTAQRCPLPSVRVRWGTTIVTPQPPPVRPRNALLRLQRASAAVCSNQQQQSVSGDNRSAATAAVSKQRQRSVSSGIQQQHQSVSSGPPVSGSEPVGRRAAAANSSSERQRSAAAVAAADPEVPEIPAVPAVPATPPRRGRPPGSKSRPRVFTEATSTTPPVRQAAIASARRTRLSLARE